MFLSVVFLLMCVYVCVGGRGELICDVPSQMKPNNNHSKWSKNALREAEYVSTWSNYKCDQYNIFRTFRSDWRWFLFFSVKLVVFALNAF